MNPHFRPSTKDDDHDREPFPPMPSRGYGRIDHVILPAVDSTTALVVIDLVDADWLDGQAQHDARFNVSDTAARSQAWHAYKTQLSGTARPANPFDKAPLFRLEIDVPMGTGWLGMRPIPSPQDPAFDAEVRRLEAQWIELHAFSPAPFGASDAARLYAGLFSDPDPVYVQGKLPSRQQGSALSDIFSLHHLPVAATDDVESILADAGADMLCVYDVGQGNANALVHNGLPTIYYDLGAGVYGNKRTTPAGLRFCFSARTPILLSHWDADHWAGAYATKVGAGYPALSRDWIAPLQTIGPVHTAFAHDIVTNLGNLFIYSPPPGVIGSTTMASGHVASFTTGSGSDKNGSGIVLVIENVRLPNGPVSWILTGDCDYRYFIAALVPSPPVGIVAPHHGADLHAGSVPPSPASIQDDPYHRLAYSFGKDNAHGRTGVTHPTIKGMTAHHTVGWNHAAWMPSSPGHPIPNAGDDILATCEHSPGAARDGVVIGWTSPPAPYGIPCGGKSCTIHVGKS